MVPFVEAVLKLRRPYLNDGLDIFKSSFSVSGAARLKKLKEMEPDSFFCLFPKRHADLYQALRSQLTGGLSIVCSRLAIAGETKIRPHQIKDPETCRKCLGVDANALQSTLDLTDLDLTDFGFNGLRILPFCKHRLLYM